MLRIISSSSSTPHEQPHFWNCTLQGLFPHNYSPPMMMMMMNALPGLPRLFNASRLQQLMLGAGSTLHMVRGTQPTLPCAPETAPPAAGHRLGRPLPPVLWRGGKRGRTSLPLGRRPLNEAPLRTLPPRTPRRQGNGRCSGAPRRRRALTPTAGLLPLLQTRSAPHPAPRANLPTPPRRRSTEDFIFLSPSLL